MFRDEFVQAGEIAHDLAEGEGWYLDQEHHEANYVYIPPVEVDFEYPFLNAAAGISPSPDWFTGFYLFDTVDEYDRTYWDHFTIRTYPWDAGTDAGQHYTSEDRDMDPSENVFRMFPNRVPESGAFLSHDGKEVLPVGEFECVLHTCPIYDSNCLKPNWPPANYCDVLKYPTCDKYCTPGQDEVCEPCKGNGYEPRTVFHPDCCAAGKDPRRGPTCFEQEQLEGPGPDSGARTTLVSLSLAVPFAGALLAFFQ